MVSFSQVTATAYTVSAIGALSILDQIIGLPYSRRFYEASRILGHILCYLFPGEVMLSRSARDTTAFYAMSLDERRFYHSLYGCLEYSARLCRTPRDRQPIGLTLEID